MTEKVKKHSGFYGKDAKKVARDYSGNAYKMTTGRQARARNAKKGS